MKIVHPVLNLKNAREGHLKITLGALEWDMRNKLAKSSFCVFYIFHYVIMLALNAPANLYLGSLINLHSSVTLKSII